MATRTQTDRHTYICVLQCSPASVGLAQARPKNTLADAQVTTKCFSLVFCCMLDIQLSTLWSFVE